MPSLSHKSSLQPGRLRVTSGISPPEAIAGIASDDLKRSIEGGIAQASVMWLLHGGLEVVQGRREPLEQQIVQFSPAVFEALVSSYPVLRQVGNERLWLIYFKGILNANAHPREETVSAFRNIASKHGFGVLPRPPKGTGETEKTPHGPTSDAEALEQIARGLELGNNCFET